MVVVVWKFLPMQDMVAENIYIVLTMNAIFT
jgi:hypothetical protein